MGSMFEIRVCESCGLRYPLTEANSFGLRCPSCLGVTYSVASKQLTRESPPEQRKPREGNHAVLIDNIRSAWNVGSIFRSADGFGFSHVFLCGITPTPDVESVRKTSLGADDYVTWSYHKDALKLVKGLKKEGWKIWALEDDSRARPMMKDEGKKIKRNKSGPAVLIAGSEVTGVDPGLLDECDEILYIPMWGQKKSFNVAVAFGIAAFAFSG
jgi:tRNA G18 (ribose-2'-O)-methylase SpoU